MLRMWCNEGDTMTETDVGDSKKDNKKTNTQYS